MFDDIVVGIKKMVFSVVMTSDVLIWSMGYL